jgi:uncharacterized protein (TIGR03437 family)
MKSLLLAFIFVAGAIFAQLPLSHAPLPTGHGGSGIQSTIVYNAANGVELTPGVNPVSSFAPGMVLKVYTGIDPGQTLSADPSQDLPYTLGCMTAFVGGSPAPIFSIAPNYIWIQVPNFQWEVSTQPNSGVYNVSARCGTEGTPGWQAAGTSVMAYQMPIPSGFRSSIGGKTCLTVQDWVAGYAQLGCGQTPKAYTDGNYYVVFYATGMTVTTPIGKSQPGLAPVSGTMVLNVDGLDMPEALMGCWDLGKGVQQCVARIPAIASLSVTPNTLQLSVLGDGAWFALNLSQTINQ